MRSKSSDARATFILQISISIFLVFVEKARFFSKLSPARLGRLYALSSPSLRFTTSPRYPQYEFGQKMTTFEHTFTWSVLRPLSRPETFPLTSYDRPGLIPPLSKSSSVLSRLFSVCEAGSDSMHAVIRRRELLTL